MSYLKLNKTLMMLFIIVFFFLNTIFASENKITLASDPWAPYYGPNLKNNGYFAHIISEAFKRKGYTLEVKFVPWKRAVEYSKIGDYDGLLSASYVKERLEFYEFSDSIDTFDMVFFTKKTKNISFKKLKDLSKYTIAIVKGYHYSDEFNKAKRYLHIYESYHSKDNIKLLIHNRVDLIIGAKKVINSLIKKHYPKYEQEIKSISPILSSNKLYITISKKRKNYKKIIHDFNEGLKEIKKDGTFDKILSEYDYK